MPPRAARVTDLTNTLPADTRAALDRKLAAFEARKGSQIAVLLVATTAPESIEQYSLRVAEAWKLGRAGVDDGVLLLVAVQDRRARLEVGYGLEGAVPDALARRIIAEQLAPRFVAGDLRRRYRRGRRRADRTGRRRAVACTGRAANPTSSPGAQCRCCSCSRRS